MSREMHGEHSLTFDEAGQTEVDRLGEYWLIKKKWEGIFRCLDKHKHTELEEF